MLVRLSDEKRRRVQRIKESLVGSPPGICAERARQYTAAYEEFSSDPPILLRARALKRYLERKTIYFGDDDLIPGYQASRPRWAPVFPEYSWEWIHREIDSFGERRYDRFIVSRAVKEELKELLPKWKGRTLFDRISGRQPEYVRAAARIGVTSWMGQATAGEGHIVVDHRIALKEGFRGIQRRAVRLRQSLRLYEPDSLSKSDFHEAVETALKASLHSCGGSRIMSSKRQGPRQTVVEGGSLSK